jgi:hypothetical protein
MVATHWVKMLAVEASAPGSSSVVLESSVAVSGTESVALALASVTSSSMVA